MSWHAFTTPFKIMNIRSSARWHQGESQRARSDYPQNTAQTWNSINVNTNISQTQPRNNLPIAENSKCSVKTTRVFQKMFTTLHLAQIPYSHKMASIWACALRHRSLKQKPFPGLEKLSTRCFSLAYVLQSVLVLTDSSMISHFRDQFADDEFSLASHGWKH